VGGQVIGGIITFLLIVWAWDKFLWFLRWSVYPWLFRFTALAGAAFPDVHRHLYLAPYYRRELPLSDFWAAVVAPLTPLAVFALALGIVQLYFLLLSLAAEELSGEKPNPAGAFGYLAATVLLGLFHAAVAAATPPLRI